MAEGGWIDVSRALDPARLQVWPGDPPLRAWLVSRIDPHSGSSANVTAASLSLHSGTHIDAPRHYIPGGKAAEEIPLEACIGPARLLHHAPRRHVTASDVAAQLMAGARRILLATSSTGAAQGRFAEDYLALLPQAARRLVEEGIRLVGIDSPSIGPPGPEGEETHRILLEAEVVVLEGLVLEGLPAGDYELVALPVAVWGSDGAPVRAAVRPLGKPAS